MASLLDGSATAMRSAGAGRIGADLAGSQVRITGWVHRRRDLGGLVFLDVRDRYGLLQASVGPDWSSSETLERARGLGAEDVVAIPGHGRPAPPGGPQPRDGNRRRRGPGRRARGPEQGMHPADPRAPAARRGSCRRRSSGCAIGCSTCAGATFSPGWPCGTGWFSRCATTSTSRASSKSRLRSSPSPPPKARATSWCPAACTRESSSRCRRVPRSTSSCS